MRITVLILIFISLMFGYDMDDLLVIESKLYPKMVLLEKSVPSEKITIGIIYDLKSENIAKTLKKYLEMNNVSAKLLNKNNIREYDVNAYIVTYKNVERNLLKYVINQHKLLFGIYPDSINNTMISLYIGTRIKPIINPYLIKKAKINLNPIIFKVAEIYEEK